MNRPPPPPAPAQPSARATRLAAKHFRIAKSGGDDLYSWALFKNGRTMYNGLSRHSALYARDKAIRELALRMDAEAPGGSL